MRSVTGSRNREQGTALVMVAVFIVALLGFAALSVDVGNMYVQRARVQEAIDSGTLAAVRSWAIATPAVEVIQMGKTYAISNGAQQVDIQSVDPGYWINATKTFVGPLGALPTPLPAGAIAAVRIIAYRTVQMPFAAVVGFPAMRPRLESVAVAGVSRSAPRVLPWAMCFDGVPKIPCTPVNLKYASLKTGAANSCSDGAGSSQFGALALGDKGADPYKDNIRDGYSKILHVGDCVDTEPGNMMGPTEQGLDDRLAGLPPYTCTTSPPSDAPMNKRLAIVPAIKNLAVNGRSQVCIDGFYVVVLDNIDKANHQVNGRYLYSYVGTEIDPTSTTSGGELAAIGLVK